jgi:F-type H+-transporting ATPase subunit epsilon
MTTDTHPRPSPSRTGGGPGWGPATCKDPSQRPTSPADQDPTPSKQTVAMHLKVLLPFQVFADEPEVSRIVVDTPAGSFGFLPHRLDGTCALVPGILVFETPAHGEACIAVDEGVLVKAGNQVLISVRRAFRPDDPVAGFAANLASLRAAITRSFLTEDAEAHTLRMAMATLESGLLRQLARHERS